MKKEFENWLRQWKELKPLNCQRRIEVKKSPIAEGEFLIKLIEYTTINFFGNLRTIEHSKLLNTFAQSDPEINVQGDILRITLLQSTLEVEFQQMIENTLNKELGKQSNIGFTLFE